MRWKTGAGNAKKNFSKKLKNFLKKVLTNRLSFDIISKLSRDGASKRALKREKLSTLENEINDLVKRIWGTKVLQKNFKKGLDRDALDVLNCSSRTEQKSAKKFVKKFENRVDKVEPMC